MSDPRRTLARLGPGEHCRITEELWHERLQDTTPFHQWGSCFLEERDGDVWLWFRDPSSNARHTAARLDVAGSARAREGVEAVEAAARHAADLVTAARERGASTLDQQREEIAASTAFTSLADDLYRELLTFGPRPGGAAGPAP